MFKNAIIYRIAGPVIFDHYTLRDLLAARAFLPCAPTQPESIGWVAPREKNGLLAEVVGGQVILKLMAETKVLPPDAIKRKVDEACAHIEQTTGRKPGKKQTKEIKEEVLLGLLPTALTRRSAALLWIDPAKGLLIVDAPSAARADDAVTELVKACEGLAVSPLTTESSPAASMADWLLTGEPPRGFSVDRECELMSADEMKSRVAYGRHALDIDEVRGHIKHGKVPTRLALTWNGRVSFVLGDSGAVRKIEFLEGVLAKQSGVDAFDTDVAIVTGEMSRLIVDLIDGLGGERAPVEIAASPVQALAATLRDSGLSVTLTTGDGVHIASLGDGPDPMLTQARAIVIQHKRPSISLVQRHLQIGYNRAARLLEGLERDGVVGPMASDGQRALLVAA